MVKRSASICFALSASLVAMAAFSNAGTLSITSLGTDGTGPWTNDLSSGSVVAKLKSDVTATGTVTTASGSPNGSVSIQLRYVGSLTETPPATVTLSYNAQQNGYVFFNLEGRTPPSGAVNASYSGTVTAPASSTISDSLGSISQSPAPQGYGKSPQSSSYTGRTISPSWTLQSTSGSQKTWVSSLTFMTISASTSATNTTPPKEGVNISKAHWDFSINISTLTAS